ncbi:MAG: lactate utilization protein C [Burkholderiales bacterium]|nr:MAG: lactate utilization protein C [Burkholderiales bacterium]
MTDLDTSVARQRILARIRSAQGREGAPTANERRSVEDWIARREVGPQPTVDADRVAHFERQAARMSSTTERVAWLADVPAAVARYLDAHGLPKKAVCWNTLGDLDWAGAGLEVEARRPQGEDMVGISGAFVAVAETGTLMMLSGPDTPASMHLLPETHVAVVQAERVVGHYEDGFALARAERGELPRATNLVSGPSRTGDIEQTIVLGAHGPYRVHVLIVGAPPADAAS